MEPVRLKKHAKVWVKDEEEGWVDGVIVGRVKSSKKKGKRESHKNEESDMIMVQIGPELSKSAGDVRTVNGITDCEVRVVDDLEMLAQYDDLTTLPALHEPAVLAALHERFLSEKIYTFSGKVLLAVNPYKVLKGIYGSKTTKKYLEAGANDNLPPHVYSVATSAFKNLLRHRGRNQTILVSGESGAGKTETTKIIMRSITQMSLLWRGVPNRVSFSPTGSNVDISERVLQANPILEAFGNASTIRNGNSSRFGKLIQLKFSKSDHNLVGAHITTYLLEKSRLIHQGQQERNYHIFYAMAAGAAPEQLDAWGFQSLSNFAYISEPEGTWCDPEYDIERYRSTVQAMRVLGFSEAEIGNLLRVTAGILHLGNVEFVPGKEGEESSRVSPDEESMIACAAFCSMLEVDADDLERALCKRVIRIQGSRSGGPILPSYAKRENESYEKPVSCEQAALARDALGMALYERLFGWLVWRINAGIGTMTPKSQNSGSPKRSSSIDSRAGSLFGSGRTGRPQSFPPRARRSSSSGSLSSLDTPLSPLAVSILQGSGHDMYDFDDSGLQHNFEIGILDVFGFEVFEENGFEQFCINYCNEHLQLLFNEYVLLREQKEYQQEGIDWTFINYPDNSGCLEMIESRPMGLLALVDENCLYPQGNDLTLSSKMYSNLPKKFEHFLQPTKQEKAAVQFTIFHFAGEVTYSMEGFSRKNKNELRQEAVDLVNSSDNSLVKVLFPSNATEAAGGADIATYFDQKLGSSYSSTYEDLPTSVAANQGSAASSPGGGRFGTGLMGSPGSTRSLPVSNGFSTPQGLQQKTVLSHFKGQLQGALTNIRASETHFIRCLKPNDLNAPQTFDRVRVLQQLQYSGVLQIIQVARAGFPSRFTLASFAKRFAVLTKLLTPYSVGKTIANNNSQAVLKLCKQIVRNAGVSLKEYVQFGKTKVFLRQGAFTSLELAKESMMNSFACKIQRTYRLFTVLKTLHKGATELQRIFRGYKARYEVGEALERRYDAVTVMQGVGRGFLVRLRIRKEKERVLIEAAKKKQEARKAKNRKSKGKASKAKRVTWDLENIRVHQPTAVYTSVAEEFEEERKRRDELEEERKRHKEAEVEESKALEDKQALSKRERRQKQRLSSIDNGQMKVLPPPSPLIINSDDSESSSTEMDSASTATITPPTPPTSEIRKAKGKGKKGKEAKACAPIVEEEKEAGDAVDESVSMGNNSDSSLSGASTSSAESDGVEAVPSSSEKESKTKASKSSRCGGGRKRKSNCLSIGGLGNLGPMLCTAFELLGRPQLEIPGIQATPLRVTAAAIMFVTFIPLILIVGGLSSGFSYAGAVVMTVWIYTHVLMATDSEEGTQENGNDSDSEEDDSDDAESDLDMKKDEPLKRQQKQTQPEPEEKRKRKSQKA